MLPPQPSGTLPQFAPGTTAEQVAAGVQHAPW
jgi:hypothetical protein